MKNLSVYILYRVHRLTPELYTRVLFMASRASCLHVARITKQSLSRDGLQDPEIYGMCYSSTRKELFIADLKNADVRAMHLLGDTFDLREVFRGADRTTVIYNVCHMSNSGALLVC